MTRRMRWKDCVVRLDCPRGHAMGLLAIKGPDTNAPYRGRISPVQRSLEPIRAAAQRVAPPARGRRLPGSAEEVVEHVAWALDLDRLKVAAPAPDSWEATIGGSIEHRTTVIVCPTCSARFTVRRVALARAWLEHSGWWAWFRGLPNPGPRVAATITHVQRG